MAVYAYSLGVPCVATLIVNLARQKSVSLSLR